MELYRDDLVRTSVDCNMKSNSIIDGGIRFGYKQVNRQGTLFCIGSIISFCFSDRLYPYSHLYSQ